MVWKNRWVSAICNLLKDNSDNKIFLSRNQFFFYVEIPTTLYITFKS